MKNYVGRMELFLPMTLRPKYITYGNGKYRCKNTGLNFNVKTGTLFQDSKIPLQKWLDSNMVGCFP